MVQVLLVKNDAAHSAIIETAVLVRLAKRLATTCDLVQVADLPTARQHLTQTHVDLLVIDLALHRIGFSQHSIIQIGRLRMRGVVEDGERGLERMGEIARMGARFFCLLFRMFEQCVQLIHHRLHFERQWLGDASGAG